MLSVGGGGVFFADAERRHSLARAPEEIRIVHMEEVEEYVWSMTNEIRRKHGLKPLLHESTLRDIARGHSDDMIRRRFSNTSIRTGTMPRTELPDHTAD
ncbi:MAG: hypothetical protein FJY97_09305 [candidate division Zixibacteria bacterium]|nr:hypothetical protein [candidate division Zixibacteria bacterium]